MTDIFKRCEKECKGKDCDDYLNCVAWHTEAEHAEEGFCGHAAFLSHGCAICDEMLGIYYDIRDGKTPQRMCGECQYLFDLDSADPYGEICYDERVGVYFHCNACCFSETDAEDTQSCHRCGDALSLEDGDICYHCAYDEQEEEQSGMEEEYDVYEAL